MTRKMPMALAMPLWLAACASMPELELDEIGDAPLPRFAGSVSVQERWLTERDEADNVDSLATWHGEDGQHWLLATAKETDRLLVYEATTGKALSTYGSSGSDAGQFQRPNGISVHGDLVLVVERDNHRVQVLGLPDFRPVLSFGGEQLIKPYGLWVQPLDGGFRVYVTDNYEDSGEQIPPLAELDERVRVYTVSRDGAALSASYDKSFGDTGEGALLIVESIWGDAENGVLMIADEEQYQARNIKVYDLDGAYAGQRMGAGVFRDQPEGIALYACEDGSGYWFATDQGKDENYFHLFDRQSREYLGSFEGETTLNTDGIWLDASPMPGFEHGAFYAVHDDGGAAAFDLGEVLAALKLQPC